MDKQQNSISAPAKKKKKNKKINSTTNNNDNMSNQPKPPAPKPAAPKKEAANPAPPKTAATSPASPNKAAANPAPPNKATPNQAPKPAAPKIPSQMPYTAPFFENIATEARGPTYKAPPTQQDDDNDDEDIYRAVKAQINFLASLTPDGELIPNPNYKPPPAYRNYDNFDENDDYGDEDSGSYYDKLDDFENFEDFEDFETNIPSHNWKDFISAVRTNDLKFVEKFILSGGNVNYPVSPQSALHCAVFFQFVEMVKLLISAPRVQIDLQDDDGDTPLHTAIGEKKGEGLIRLLISKGASLSVPNNSGRTPLEYANLTKTQFIIDEVNAITDLCSKVENGDLAGVTQFLITNKVDINWVSKDGVTPLHEAALSGQHGIAALLIENGALVNSRSKGGLASESTPLHCACSKGQVQVAKLLIEKGADLNLKNLQGQAPIHCATAQNQPEIAKLLIENKSKCDINALNSGKLVALHYAIMENMLDTVKLLLKHGAYVNGPGVITPPIMYASMFPKSNSLEIVKLLVGHGAVVNAKVINAFSGKPEILSYLETVKVM